MSVDPSASTGGDVNGNDGNSGSVNGAGATGGNTDGTTGTDGGASNGQTATTVSGGAGGISQLALIGAGVAVAAVVVAVVAVIVIKRRSSASARPRAVPRSAAARGDTFDAGVVYDSSNKKLANATSPRVAHVAEEEQFEI